VADWKFTGGGVWLKKWSDHNAETGANPDVGKYIGVYFAFGIGSSALTVCQTLILWIFCSIEVCTLLTARSASTSHVVT
jgi:ATP-binding cassette, subfamily C (CFTR/MRP), member 1